MGGVPERVEETDGEVNVTGAGVEAGGTTAEAEGGVDFFESPPRAFLKRPFNPFFSGSGAGETEFDSGEGRDEGGVLVALAIGPVWSGVGVLATGLAAAAAAAEAVCEPVVALAYVLAIGRSRSEDSEDRSALLAKGAGAGATAAVGVGSGLESKEAFRT
jgi:hypothetical protein